MKECDNSTRKIHISSNFILSIILLILFDTILLRPVIFYVFVRGTHLAHTACAVTRVSLSPRRRRFSTRSNRIVILVYIVVLEQLSHQILRFH